MINQRRNSITELYFILTIVRICEIELQNFVQSQKKKKMKPEIKYSANLRIKKYPIEYKCRKCENINTFDMANN